jgi:hypothetical protein
MERLLHAQQIKPQLEEAEDVQGQWTYLVNRKSLSQG